ncbi:MAG: HDOD domain-containing protein [Rubrivivax sp.]|nr:MAG: HDOD domain-containing protein [Rubrivivax sp.]
MIDRALPHLQAWTDALAEADIPVLPSTALRIAELQALEEAKGTVDAHLLSQDLGGDPLMTLKVLVHVSRYCTRLSVEPPETLTGAILMQGIGPFFTAFGQPARVDEWLADHPEAMDGLQAVLRRSRRAAHFAYSFALHRQDEDAVIVHGAALLHDFAEMLLWCHAPALAQALSQRLAEDHTLRSADVQRELLGVELGDLAQALMRRWQLPDLLVRCTDDRHAHHPQVRTVMLSVRIARHTQYGWLEEHTQASLPDDVAEVAQLLTLSNDAALRKIQDLDD